MAKLTQIMGNPMDPANIAILQSDPRLAKLMAKFGGGLLKHNPNNSPNNSLIPRQRPVFSI